MLFLLLIILYLTLSHLPITNNGATQWIALSDCQRHQLIFKPVALRCESCRTGTSTTSTADTDGTSVMLDSSNTPFRLSHLVDNMAQAETECRSTGNAQQCQSLANMCVLQQFNQYNAQGACALLENIRRSTLSGQS